MLPLIDPEGTLALELLLRHSHLTTRVTGRALRDIHDLRRIRGIHFHADAAGEVAKHSTGPAAASSLAIFQRSLPSHDRVSLNTRRSVSYRVSPLTGAGGRIFTISTEPGAI